MCKMDLSWMLMLAFLWMSTVDSFCPDGCGCDEEKLTVTCIRAKLEVMPISLNPSIQTLILKYNEFRSVDASFNFYSELVKVDLSHNHLVSIPSRAFKSQRKLRDLRMRANKISDIDQDTFHGLTKLESLDLRENFIEKLGGRAFHPLGELKQLDLGNNKIKEIEEDSFDGISDLVVLYLDNNQLHSVPTEGLNNLPNLAELHLSQNKFKVVKEEAFLQLSLLSYLDLSGNRLKKMEDQSLEKLNGLKTLKIKDNKFKRIPTRAFRHLVNLEELSIGQNKFEVIEENSFGPLTKLKVIDISGCENLHKIESKAFSANSDLERVNIHSNRRLADIDSQSFSSAVNLRHVNFANNALTKISPTLVPWQQLKSAQLAGNPWNCDCSAMFLRDVIISLVNNSSQVRVTRCWSPPAYRDQDIVTLNLPDCHSPTWTTNPPIPNTDMETVASISTSIIAVVAVSIALILAGITVLLIHFRQELHICLKRWKSRKKRTPVHTKDILYYDDEKESHYASPYSGVRTMPGTWNQTNQMTQPIMYSPHATDTSIMYSPHAANRHQFMDNSNQFPGSLVRNDQYFITLANQNQRHHQNAPLSQL